MAKEKKNSKQKTVSKTMSKNQVKKKGDVEVTVDLTKGNLGRLLSLFPFLLIIIGIIITGWGFYDLTKDDSKKNEDTVNENNDKTDDEQGQILEDGISTDPDNDNNGSVASESTANTGHTAVGLTKSLDNQSRIQASGVWYATDYQPGDINTEIYTVQRGDTLWEISEAVYGSGFEWRTILEANKNSIGFLPNGSQALIVPNQKLILPKK